MRHPVSSLGRHVGRSPASPEDLEAMRRRAWHQQGVAMIPVDEVSNEYLRLGIEALMAERYGRRAGKCP